MADTALNANLRKTATKSIVKEIRNNGGIPGVVYGKHVGSMAISVDAKDLKNILGSVTGRNTLINMNINGSKQTVMVKSLQMDPMHQNIRHVDFQQVSENTKIRTVIPVQLVGTPKGVAMGGVIQHDLRSAEIECLPNRIPEAIQVDISGLEIGDTLSVSDLNLPPGVKILDHPHTTVVGLATIKAPEPAGQPEVPPEPAEEAKAKTIEKE
ncbi:LSU ribosomal protein L25P [Desulforamulus reducens MI-1]|uniref:Large ribosomal subunit protein bL25 n=1 Tax=Desulforamulus reducens (strain ATCC BAA-1160 / DSM 100696 / MI-1) TaxID=349161 RepID=RL25_DESRM|nr:50S ribosomal protein L25 [Desulforamulus reducens]A4J0Q5.1 RecName: Full=Large ribosomal subunit protein bL25; AltName: Full=50S ribosomal protein L25; AltName: Full=General stress protein CTC [Desulforamulus reducens MI-1]ABO48658.1 LSU ribosomal protein L25P [Desulforamulus reducens MI-1]